FWPRALRLGEPRPGSSELLLDAASLCFFPMLLRTDFFPGRSQPWLMVILAAFMTTVNAATPLPTKWPDPLVASNGMAVTNKKLWRTTRRPELKTMFEHYMYGTLPPAPLKVVSTLR